MSETPLMSSAHPEEDGGYADDLRSMAERLLKTADYIEKVKQWARQGYDINPESLIEGEVELPVSFSRRLRLDDFDISLWRCDDGVGLELERSSDSENLWTKLTKDEAKKLIQYLGELIA